jgi:hypothetical protein
VAALTAEELALLERLRQAKAAKDRIPPAERKPINNPDKYANPLGMDEDGNLFPDPQVKRAG